MAILVSNAENSSFEKCNGGCQSWRLHWENNADMEAVRCSEIDCEETEDLVGGHVYREDEDGDDCYIIPLCRKHNYVEMEEFYVHDDTEFVPDYELGDCTPDFEYDEEE